MTDENDVIFREQQKFNLWLALVIACSMALAVVIASFALLQMLSQHPLQIWTMILLIIGRMLLPVGFGIFFFIYKLEIEVNSDGLHVRSFPFHVRYRKIPAEDLSECYARTYRPIREYGGWGIRYGFRKRSGKAYNMSGNKGVQLIFKNGKRLLIGSQKPDELAEAIESIMKSH